MQKQKNKQKIKRIFLSSQSLELGRAHKKASSIVNATIDPDKVIHLYFCSIAIIFLFNRNYISAQSQFFGFLRISTQFPRGEWQTQIPTKDSSTFFQLSMC